MRIVVDRGLCIASGLCCGLAPDTLELDESGLLVVLDEQPNAEAVEDVRDAVRNCPVHALSLVED
ncbi:ferredoxin [Nocardia pseudovaccinii]|uniref:ferredoxin n=1 Tax=Nocardia pseudovaccinii TaxID=189540 RepID=UPI0007A37E1C|nr:ferredoxin [Nocardia pseudovaccinii]